MICTGLFLLIGLVSFAISIPMIKEGRRIKRQELHPSIYQAPLSGYKMDIIEAHEMPPIGCVGDICALVGVLMLIITILRILTFGIG